MEYKKMPCKVVNTFATYEECAQYLMEHEAQNEIQAKRSKRFEKYFVQILREHPVLYDEKHCEFGNEFPTKHAWSIVAGYMMMERKDVQEIWAALQKFASAGAPLYVDLVNYVKLGDGNGWIGVDEDSDSFEESVGDAAIKEEDEAVTSTNQEDEGNSSIKREDSFHIEEEVVQSVKMEVE